MGFSNLKEENAELYTRISSRIQMPDIVIKQLVNFFGGNTTNTTNTTK